MYTQHIGHLVSQGLHITMHYDKGSEMASAPLVDSVITFVETVATKYRSKS